MHRLSWILIAVVLLAGCSSLKTEPTDLPTVGSAAEAIKVSRELAHGGKWSDAVALLDQAQRLFPEDAGLAEEVVRLRAEWSSQQRSLEDRILVGDAENQRNKIDLLEKLALAEPDNLMLVSRKLYWKEVLSGKLETLTACAERHLTSEPALSQRCFAVATQIAAPGSVEERLARVEAQLRASETQAAERRRLAEERQRQVKAKKLLDDAKEAIASRDYRRALETLERVAVLQPNNSEVAGLKERAWSMISPQVEALIKLGDHLYLDEQLDAAVATWQAALSLKPGDEEITARIERAKTVLNRLDALRRQQNSATESP
ncbi:MAG: hypothetical protein H6953_09975 [Chromatiaceae bacterium]|nr:hypothetical protein [Gammaproteobacteria bacterium]MCP5305764.1 hypothetical protein [Chromatiaceae bacterium]MCP5312621.1 hypothetical protein [Chromatiaceae bacterium]